MHAINGNIDRYTLPEIFTFPINSTNGRRAIKMLVGEVSNWEHLKIFRNFDFIMLCYDTHISIINEPLPLDLEWMRFVEFIIYILTTFSSSENYRTHFCPLNVDLLPIDQRLSIGWSSYLTSNHGAHATNGNIEHYLIEDIMTMAFTADHIYLLVCIMMGVEPGEAWNNMVMQLCVLSFEEISDWYSLDEGIVFDNPFLFDCAIDHIIYRLDDFEDELMFVDGRDPTLEISLHNALKQAWCDHLLSNRAMHATNGNGNTPQMRIPGFPINLTVSPDEETTLAMENLTDLITNGLDVNMTHTVDSQDIAKFQKILSTITESLAKTEVNTNVSLDFDGIFDMASIVLLVATSVNYYHRPTNLQWYHIWCFNRFCDLQARSH